MRLALVAAIYAISAHAAPVQPSLDQPGEKKITLGSEIARGASEISSSCINHNDISLVYLEGHMSDVVIQNKSRQKDSEGFMLGARVQELVHLDLLLSLDGMRQFNNQEAITNALEHAHKTALEIRKQQKELGISDDALVDALEIKREEGKELIKRVIAKYEAGVEAPPEPGPASAQSAHATPISPPQTLSLTQSISMQLPYGNVVLPTGTKMQLVARNGQNVRIRYMGTEYEIPISATDLK